MTAKEHLRQIHLLQIKIRRIENEVDEIQRIATSVGALNYEKDRVQVSGNGDIVSNSAIAYVDAVSELITLKEEMIQARINVISEIHNLTDARYVELLERRYIDCQSLERIACDMGYSFTRIAHMHGEALIAFESVNMTNNSK